MKDLIVEGSTASVTPDVANCEDVKVFNGRSKEAMRIQADPNSDTGDLNSSSNASPTTGVADAPSKPPTTQALIPLLKKAGFKKIEHSHFSRLGGFNANCWNGVATVGYSDGDQAPIRNVLGNMRDTINKDGRWQAVIVAPANGYGDPELRVFPKGVDLPLDQWTAEKANQYRFVRWASRNVERVRLALKNTEAQLTPLVRERDRLAGTLSVMEAALRTPEGAALAEVIDPSPDSQAVTIKETSAVVGMNKSEN